MKRIPCVISLLVLSLGCSCVWTQAAEKEASGLYSVAVESGYEALISLQPQTKDGTEVTAVTAEVGETSVTDFYPNAEKLRMTYSGAEPSAQYLVLVLNDDKGAPAENNVVYIDQAGTETDTVSFTAYPSALSTGKEYGVYLSSSAGTGVTALTKVASFRYYAPYTLGDVNEDGKINATDATQILRYYNGLKPNALEN